MKKLIILLSLLLACYYSTAQQLPLYSQYLHNSYVLNPAIGGITDYHPFVLGYRSQWGGMSEAPKTQTLSFHKAQNEKVGWGMILYNDNTGGAIKHTGTMLSYSYRMPLANGKLSMGLAANINQFSFDNEGLNPDDEDPLLQGGVEKSIVPDANFGMCYYTDNFYVGASVPNLIQSKISLNSSSENHLVRHYFLNTGYRLDMGNIQLEPSVLFKSIITTGVQMDVNLKATFSELIWAGFSYRNQDALVAMLGLDYKQYFVGYSYDYAISDIGMHSVGSHEVYVGYKLNFNKEEAIADEDGDGVADEFDHCPKTFGVAENNGCPIITEEQQAVIDTAFTNLEFEYSQSVITFSSYAHLDRLGVLLFENPDMRLLIEGHTDNTGGEEKNKTLSIARANAVKEYLVKRGIDASRIKTVGYGESKPIASNETVEGKALNRRVELTIYFE